MITSVNPTPAILIASVTECLAALRAAAPDAQIILLIPFGQYEATEIKAAAENHRKENPTDRKIAIIDLGPGLARNLEKKRPDGWTTSQ